MKIRRVSLRKKHIDVIYSLVYYYAIKIPIRLIENLEIRGTVMKDTDIEFFFKQVFLCSYINIFRSAIHTVYAYLFVNVGIYFYIYALNVLNILIFQVLLFKNVP